MEFENGGANTLTLNGIFFKTGGNILFSDTKDCSYHLAQNSRLEKIEGLLENGMQTILEKTD